MNTETNATIDLAHEAWAAAQLAPGEGIEDAVRRIAGLIAAALDSQDRQMAELRGMLDEYRKECEACFVIAQRLDARNGASSFIGVPSERIARQVEALTTERDDLHKRIGDTAH